MKEGIKKKDCQILTVRSSRKKMQLAGKKNPNAALLEQVSKRGNVCSFRSKIVSCPLHRAFFSFSFQSLFTPHTHTFTMPYDPTSQSNIDEFKTNHIHLDLTVDFSAKTLSGSAELELETIADNVSKVVLDTSYIDVRSVTSNGKALQVWSISRDHQRHCNCYRSGYSTLQFFSLAS
jgi:hypothetical protein